MNLRYWCTLLLAIFFKSADGQFIPTDYFSPPLDGILQLSGTFAELRSNHFHSGIDLRTGGKEGLPIRACANGYVVRIRIQPGGFGKALYVNHPNGYTTVYAHLLSFNQAIDDWARARQYEAESFDVDLFPPKDLLRVQKGEIIASSGNSGASEGPHLHFEIRETKTELPMDPMLFGFPIKDFIRPTMNGLRIYPESTESQINSKAEPATFTLSGWGPVYRLKITDTVEIAGRYSIGLSASDLLNESGNKNGVVLYKVLIDSISVFEWNAIKFAFSETRYINSFIDYKYYYSSNQRYMRTRVDPGNKLSMYQQKGNGVFTAIPGRTQTVKVIVADSKQNESVLTFIIKGRTPVKQPAPVVSGTLFTIDKINTFSARGINLTLPGKCLYDSMRFEYTSAPALPFLLSDIHSLHRQDTPLHEHFDLSIKVRETAKVDPKQLTVVRLNAANKPVSVGGKYENGFIKVRVRDYGRYSVMADSIPPVIKGVNITDNMSTKGINEIRINISDDLSGIRSYRGTINGAWILMDYDQKNKLLTYKRDALLPAGNNTLILTVEDYVGNISVAQWKLIE